MILVPADMPGITVHRMLTVMGYDDAPHGHGEVEFKDVRVPASNMLLGEGRGFEIAQGRLGPGRIHHCMRLIGVAERALELMCKRATERTTWGKTLAERGVTQERIAKAHIDIEMHRLLVLKAAYMMDTVGNKRRRVREIAMIKGRGAEHGKLNIIDNAMQLHGGGAMTRSSRLPICGHGPAHCGLRTVRTKFIASESPGSSCGRSETGRRAAKTSTKTRRQFTAPIVPGSQTREPSSCEF